MARRTQTYDEFAIHTIMPAAGWQAVFFDDMREEQHFVLPVHALALVSRLTYVVGSRTPYHEKAIDTPDIDREIVAMNYSLTDGWSVMDDSANFCGLLPPGKALHDHETDGNCWHARETRAQHMVSNKGLLTS